MTGKDSLLYRFFTFFALFVGSVRALSSISVKGTKLYDEEGNQFFVKGVVYAPAEPSIDQNADPLLDAKRCQRDAGLIRDLGANTIRVPEVDYKGDHDACMQAFEEAGIYVWLDLPTVQTMWNRLNPKWTQEMYDVFTGTVDTFSKYDHLLFFTIGHEVMLDSDQDVGQYIKAAVRDVKAFRNARGYRPIPITYNSVDTEELRAVTAEFMACGDEEETIDAYGVNVYTWCGDSSFYEAGFNDIYEEFEDFNLPLIFAETGCLAEDGGERQFEEVEAMLGNVFQAVFSGVVVFEWAMHINEYGLVVYPNTSLGTGFPSTIAEYNHLASVFSTMDPTGTSRDRYSPTNSPPECPQSLFGWMSRQPLPTISGLDTDTVTARESWSEPATQTGSETSIEDDSSPRPTGTSGEDTSQSNREGVGAAGDDAGAESGDSGLSAGAIGGIAAGIAVVAIGIAVAAFFFIRARRRANKTAPLPTETAAELDNEKKGGSPGVYEVGSPVPEMPAGRQYMTQELDGGYYVPSRSEPAKLDAPVYELPAGR